MAISSLESAKWACGSAETYSGNSRTSSEMSDIERLSEIKCPTLVIAGENDRIRSLDEARELNDRIPNSTLRIVPQSGHMIPMEQPSELAEIVGSWLHKTIANKARGDMA